MDLSASSERRILWSRRCMLVSCCVIVCVAKLAAQVAGAPGAASSSTGRTGQGAIEGTVVNEATREAVRGAQIVVGSEAGVPAALTHPDGHFAFCHLGPRTAFFLAPHPQIPRS